MLKKRPNIFVSYRRADSAYAVDSITDKLIESKSLIAYINHKNAPELVEEIFQLAEAIYQTDIHPTLLYAFMAMQIHNTIRDVKKGIEYGEKAMQVVQKPSVQYYKVGFTLIGDYCYGRQVDKAQKLIEEIEAHLDDTQIAANLKLTVKVYRANLQIKMLQRKKKYRKVKSHYQISNKEGKGSIFLCLKRVKSSQNARKIREKTKLYCLDLLNLDNLVVANLVKSTLQIQNQSKSPPFP